MSKLNLIISFVWKNCKLEALIIMSGILWINLSWRITEVTQILADYFSESWCSGIEGVASVIIGIYLQYGRFMRHLHQK